MSKLKRSWVESANSAQTDFPLNNLPYGSASREGGLEFCAVAIGDQALDVTALEAEGLIVLPEEDVFALGSWNEFMAFEPEVWSNFRARLTEMLSEGSSDQEKIEPHLHALADLSLHMPFDVIEYTDFYAGRHHATNVGTMFRGPENALPPNWLHIPIGYNGRASSVVVSGTDVRRPWGQLKGPNDEMPRFAPCNRWDYELEMGAIVGRGSDGPISVAKADENIFGYVILNDWSARDIQAWEYQPLGPFQAKATATTISPWIVTAEALAEFRTSTPPREKPLLPHLQEPGPMLYDIALEVALETAQGRDVLTRTNYKEMYYSSAQQLAHHSTSGCPMNPGDLLGSGTISGPEKHERGSLLELSWGGKEPIEITGGTRSFIEDGDTIVMSGHAQGDGFKIGFGECRGTTLAALDNPFEGENT